MRKNGRKSGDGRIWGSLSGRIFTYIGVLASVVVIVVAVVALMIAQRPERKDPRYAFTELEAARNVESPDSRPQVEVLNGCGVSNVAAQAHEYLKRLGFDVVNVENARAFDYEKTLVIDRSGDVEIARRIARFLGTENVICQVRPELMLQVTVILGKDYRTLKPYGEVEP